MENHLIIEKKGAIGIIAIDRPRKLNALNKEVIDQLSTALRPFWGPEHPSDHSHGRWRKSLCGWRRYR